MKELTFVEAIREAVDEEMARDPTVIFLGTDVGPIGGQWANSWAHMKSMDRRE